MRNIHRSWRCSLFLLPGLLLSQAACTTTPAPAPEVQALFPAAGQVPGWAPADEPQCFAGDELFQFIDGGADLYLEYGFEKAAARTYRHTSGLTINTEIYRMKSPAAAYGVFSVKRDGRGEPAAVGSEASRSGYYLNCWKGDCIFTLTSLEEKPETPAGLEALARAMAERVPAADRPELVNRLPSAGLNPQSVRYLAGPLGTANSPAGEILAYFRAPAAVYGEYGEAARVVLVFGSAAEAAGRLREAVEKAGGKPAADPGGPAVFTYRRGSRHGRAGQQGERIFLALAGSADEAERLLRSW